MDEIGTSTEETQSHQESLISEIETPIVRTLREQLNEARWERAANEARGRAAIIEEVKEEHRGSGLSLRKCLTKVVPEVSWSLYQSWCRRARERSGPIWERLMDRRIPPLTDSISESVRQAARTLRYAVPTMDCDTARKHLVKQFGKEGQISDTSLRRIWSAAGLTQAANSPRPKRGKRYDGGAGLAFLLAAGCETNAFGELAAAALESGQEAAENQKDKVLYVEPEGRDHLGRLTATYNHGMRAEVAPGQPDSRHQTEESKRNLRDLKALATLQNRTRTLEAKLLTMGVYALLTERRGFEGLDGPRGALLGLLNGVPYMPGTINKCLSELAAVNVGDAMWGAHARKWNQVSREWSKEGQPWLQMATYVDTTTDPYWTRRFALASKVSQVGRVMPCLSRVYVHVGPGVPLAVDTFVGTVSLKKQLVPTLKKLEEVIGEGELGRLTIVDAESATFDTLSALAAMPNRIFITIWKGVGANPKAFKADSRWKRFRTRDRVRDGEVVLHKTSDTGEKLTLDLRAVEMKRADSRHPHTTIFLTNDKDKELSQVEVAEAYLSRWPYQEQRFRNNRNGMGTNRSHGYGGENVQHVALETSLEESKRRQDTAARKLEAAERTLKDLQAGNKLAKSRVDRKASNYAVKSAERNLKTSQKALDKAAADHKKNETTCRTIYRRDTTRDGIVTVLIMAATMQIEFVLRQYFDGLKMEYRTFIEHLMNAPTTMTKTRGRILYQIETNPRNPQRSDQIRRACAEVTRRGLRHDGKLLVFEAIDPSG
jgi:hypothetical protein